MSRSGARKWTCRLISSAYDTRPVKGEPALLELRNRHCRTPDSVLYLADEVTDKPDLPTVLCP